DVYALGAILYESLTGRAPFLGANVAETLAQVVEKEPVPPSQLQLMTPRDLETICLKCLEKEPARRYGTALELADDLCRFLAMRRGGGRGSGVGARPWGGGGRTPHLALLLGALGVTVFASLVVCGWFWYQAVESGNKKEVARREAE